MEFSKIIKQTRQKNNISIYRLSIDTGLTRKAIMDIENGADVKMSNAIKICKALGIAFCINPKGKM